MAYQVILKFQNVCLITVALLFIIALESACNQAGAPEKNKNAEELQFLDTGKVYDGFICVGYEQNFFVSDPHNIFDWKDQYYHPWVEFDETIDDRIIKEIYRNAVVLSPKNKIDSRKAIWVRVVGFEEHKKDVGFGHDNAYERRLTIKQVISYSSDRVKSLIEQRELEIKGKK